MSTFTFWAYIDTNTFATLTSGKSSSTCSRTSRSSRLQHTGLYYIMEKCAYYSRNILTFDSWPVLFHWSHGYHTVGVYALSFDFSRSSLIFLTSCKSTPPPRFLVKGREGRRTADKAHRLKLVCWLWLSAKKNRMDDELTTRTQSNTHCWTRISMLGKASWTSLTTLPPTD